MDLEDLEQMTSEAIELFRKGQQQAALDLAVDFSKNAEMLLGRSHPVNVNALATVAALAEQMGCRREAEELLQEAEELHQEHLEDMDDLATESSRSHSRSSQSSEAAAEGIEHLTWEVQELLKDGHPELAAKLLSEAEVSVLAGGQENPTLHYLKKASLHTLWAAVLEDIGEKDKAAKLYDEALTCLRHDEPQHLDSCTSSDASHRTSHSGGSGGSASAESFKVPPEQQVLLPLEEKMKLLMEREEPEQKTCLEAAHEPQQLREAELPKPEALSGIPEPPKPEASSPAKAKGAEPSQSSAYEPSTPAPAPAPDVTVVISAVKSLASQVSPAPQPPRASPSTPTPATPATPATSPPKAAPATPPKATPKRRPPPLAPKATPLATAVRVGGGFKLPKAPPKASSAKAAPRKVKAKAKAKTVETVETVEMETETPTQETPEPSKEELGARLTEAAKKAMVTADHFLGLAKFDRAADVLEDQLMEISSDNCPLRNSNLHIELLEKYGGILWWDGDLESAIDAYAAADEVLTERGADSGTGSDPQLLMRRAKIWSLVAQIHRKSGDLEAADRHLQAAMHSLEVLPKMPSGSDKTYSPMALDDLLRDLQAALGQVCVEKKEYSRAQELYLMAFSPQKPAETFSLTASENV